MRPLLTAESKIPRSNDPGALLKSIPETLADASVPFGGIRFLITHEDTRIIDRILKAEPVLSAYRSELDADLFMLSGDLDVADPAFEALCRVGTGISRRFQARNFTVGFVGIDWGAGWTASLSGLEEALQEEDNGLSDQIARLGFVPDLSASIFYRNARWVNGRNQSLSVKLIPEAPETPDSKPAVVPAEILEVLGNFGKFTAKRFTLTVMPTAGEVEDSDDSEPERIYVDADAPAEAAIVDRRDEIYRIRESAAALMAKVRESGLLPHGLSTPNVPGAGVVPETGIPKRRIISAALGPLGYKHLGKFGGQGLMVFGKISETNTKLTVEFDFGTWAPRLEPTLTVAGATWKVSFPLDFGQPESLPFGRFTPYSREQFSAALDNVAVVLRELESVVVQPLEQAFGTAPAWTARF